MITNVTNLPAPVHQAICNHLYSSGGADISCTALIDPPQIFALKRKHSDEIVEDCADMLYALFGTMVHRVLEQAEVDGAVTEKRLFADVLGWTVSGQFDLLHDGVLSDYKMSSVWEWIYGLKQTRIDQLNVLAWLCRRNGHHVNKLEVCFLFRDWSKTKAKFDPSYPQHQIATMAVELWSDSQAQEYVETRVRLHQAALEGDYEPCSDEDRWAKPTTYAVMKTGRKSALKLCQSQDEADAWMADNADKKATHIDVRPGEQTRCENYCAVAPFCPQYQALLGSD